MAQTYIGSSLRIGSTAVSDKADGGFVVASQSVDLAIPLTAVAGSATITLPAGSAILSYTVDKLVLQTGGTATAFPTTVGTAAAGAQYMTSTDLVSTTRASVALTVAQLLAMSAIGTNTSVVITTTPNGTTAVQGTLRLTVIYASKL